MTAYFILTYDIADPEQYTKYNPGSNELTGSTIAKHGGELLAATNEGLQLDGHDADIKVVLQFPSRSAAQAWVDDPDYAPAKAIRLASTKNLNAFIVDKL